MTRSRTSWWIYDLDVAVRVIGANALPRWDHLKLGRVYTVILLTGTVYEGTLVDAGIITPPSGYPVGAILALSVEEAPPASIPLTAVAAIIPIGSAEA